MDILPQLLVNALITGSIYALAASGLSLSYGVLRILNFAHGHLMMLGAYLFFLFSITLQWGLFSSALGTALAMGLAGILTLSIFVQPFFQFSPLIPFVTTLSLATILESAVSILFGVNVKSLSISYDSPSLEFWGVFITTTQILIISSALLILSALAVLIHCTAIGRKIRAIAELEHSAQSLGISAQWCRRVVFVLGTVLAAYTGILVGFETNLQPTMGGSYTIKAFAAMTLGGLGNLWGTVAGAYLLGLIENLSIGLDFGGYSLPAGYKDAFAFIAILLVLLLRPQGLFNRAQRKV
jgi:branched-chain amino acid transport system permease protein